jgi:uncharacterized glyoxalase superfamily protein PhnB
VIVLNGYGAFSRILLPASTRRLAADLDAPRRSRSAAGTRSRCVFASTTQDYGEDYGAHRTYEAIDPEGHHWWFMQRVRGPKQ